jgi:hypothetical protein
VQPRWPEPLRAEEPLSRFLTQSGHFAENRVKRRAFLPARDGSTSTFRTRGPPESEIWALGDLRVAPPPNGRLYGRGDLPVSVVIAAGLRVDPDDIPPRHAAIVGWPAEKDAQNSKAQELAAAAALILRTRAHE